MTSSQKKLLVGGTLLIAAIAYLGISAVRAGSSYYMDVDKFVDQFQAKAAAHTAAIRLHGRVAKKGLSIASSGTVADFIITGAKHRLPVHYKGVLPELFKAGCEVVVLGRLDDKGTFQAKQVLTKCASKYRPKGDVSRRPK